MGNTTSSTERSEGELHELPEELLLLIMSFLYTPSDTNHSCGDMTRLMCTCRALNNLIHCEKAQLGLWLPWTARTLDQTVEETIKAFEREDDKEMNWKDRFVEVSSSPVFNPLDISSVYRLVDNWTVLDVGEAPTRSHTYFYARARLPILPGTRRYFEVKVLNNRGSAMVGVMLKKGALGQSIPTKNFYHGLFGGYNMYQHMQEPIVGVLVCNDQNDGSCILHFFVNDSYTHSERLTLNEMKEEVAQPVYPAIATHSATDSLQFVRCNKSINASLPPIGSTWPLHRFASYGLGTFESQGHASTLS